MGKDLYKIPNSTVGAKITQRSCPPTSNVAGSLASKTKIGSNPGTFHGSFPTRKIPVKGVKI